MMDIAATLFVEPVAAHVSQTAAVYTACGINDSTDVDTVNLTIPD